MTFLEVAFLKMDTTKLGQLTLKDCWISSAMIGILLVTEDLPGVKIDGQHVSLPNNVTVKLTSLPMSTAEALIRATRVYFSGLENQSNMRREHLEKYGSPDTISKFFLGKGFDTYALKYFSYANMFYTYLPYTKAYNMILNKKHNDVMLITFKHNSSSFIYCIKYRYK